MCQFFGVKKIKKLPPKNIWVNLSVTLCSSLWYSLPLIFFFFAKVNYSMSCCETVNAKVGCVYNKNWFCWACQFFFLLLIGTPKTNKSNLAQTIFLNGAPSLFDCETGWCARGDSAVIGSDVSRSHCSDRGGVYYMGPLDANHASCNFRLLTPLPHIMAGNEPFFWRLLRAIKAHHWKTTVDSFFFLPSHDVIAHIYIPRLIYTQPAAVWPIGLIMASIIRDTWAAAAICIPQYFIFLPNDDLVSRCYFFLLLIRLLFFLLFSYWCTTMEINARGIFSMFFLSFYYLFFLLLLDSDQLPGCSFFFFGCITALLTFLGLFVCVDPDGAIWGTPTPKLYYSTIPASLSLSKVA